MSKLFLITIYAMLPLLVVESVILDPKDFIGKTKQSVHILLYLRTYMFQ
jgi:hypothetical protein